MEVKNWQFVSNFEFFLNQVSFERQLFRKLSDICCIVLLGHKFFAPCDPVDHLSHEYGSNIEDWLEPKEDGYFMANLERSVDWSPQEWFHVIRCYMWNGSLSLNRTLTLLNAYNPYKNSTEITWLPDDQNIL
jgi:hypothetical protein